MCNCINCIYFVHSHRSKDIKKELVKEWLEDDFEWPQQKKTYSGTKKKMPHHKMINIDMTDIMLHDTCSGEQNNPTHNLFGKF